jgi:hypothetical protein
LQSSALHVWFARPHWLTHSSGPVSACLNQSNVCPLTEATNSRLPAVLRRLKPSPPSPLTAPQRLTSAFDGSFVCAASRSALAWPRSPLSRYACRPQGLIRVAGPVSDPCPEDTGAWISRPPHYKRNIQELSYCRAAWYRALGMVAEDNMSGPLAAQVARPLNLKLERRPWQGPGRRT